MPVMIEDDGEFSQATRSICIVSRENTPRPDPTSMDGLEFAARPNASDSERTRLLKQVHSFHKQQAQKRVPLNACKHSEGKSHRKPLVG